MSYDFQPFPPRRPHKIGPFFQYSYIRICIIIIICTLCAYNISNIIEKRRIRLAMFPFNRDKNKKRRAVKYLNIIIIII